MEFLDPLSAQQMVNYWVQTSVGGMPAPMQPSIRGRHVFCQLSNHKELKTNPPHNEHAPEVANGTSREPTCVLRVVVENLLYSVSLEVLHSVFSRAGKVQKIVTFTKNGAFQALVQFETAREAQTARAALDGQNLFHHANTLRIEFSKLPTLNVKYNNDKSRDYTNPTLPSLQATPTQDHFDQSLMTSLMSGHAQSPPQQNNLFNPFVNQTLRALNPLHALNALQSQSLGQLQAHLGLGRGARARPGERAGPVRGSAGVQPERERESSVLLYVSLYVYVSSLCADDHD